MWAHVEYFETVVKSTILTDRFLPGTDSMGTPQVFLSTAVTEPNGRERVRGHTLGLRTSPPQQWGTPGACTQLRGKGPRGKGGLLKTREQGSPGGGKMIMFSFPFRGPFGT